MIGIARPGARIFVAVICLVCWALMSAARQLYCNPTQLVWWALTLAAMGSAVSFGWLLGARPPDAADATAGQ